MVNTQLKGYDSEAAATLLGMAKAIYQPRNKVKQILNETYGCPRFRFISRRTTQCFVASNDEAMFVVFRGTETDKIEDILTDLDTEQIKAYGALLHKGFAYAYRLVRQAIISEIKLQQSKANKPLPIYIGGHSLGGAISVVAAADFHKKNLPWHGIYTAGQPRVGSPDFIQKYKEVLGERLFRFVNVDDLVPSVPPKQIPFTDLHFEHMGHRIWVVDEKRITDDYVKDSSFIGKLENLSHALDAHSSKVYALAAGNNIGFNPLLNGQTIEDDSDIENAIADFFHDTKKQFGKTLSKWF